MELSRLSLKRSLFLSAVITVSLFSNNAVAQNSQPTSAATSRQTTSSSSARTTAQTSTNTSPNTRSSSSSVTPPTLPAIGTTTSTTSNAGPTALPTLTGTIDTQIPEYPAPTIPPTNNAPFMNHSTLPDGTVFICVGAILGAFGLAIIAWRGIIACLLHRSVERATLAQHAANDKSFPAPPSQFYKFLERDPSPSHGHAAAIAGKIHRKSYKGPSPSATASQTNLFFSPTAGPGGSTGIASATNRDSRFLPSGFYASAGPMPGAGHTAGNSISLSTLRPSSRGNVVPSPPESPNVGPTRNYSASSVNLNRPPSGNGRAPSAFLDDLLDEPAAQGRGGQYLPAGGAYRVPDGQFYGGNPSPPGNRY